MILFSSFQSKAISSLTGSKVIATFEVYRYLYYTVPLVAYTEIKISSRIEDAVSVSSC